MEEHSGQLQPASHSSLMTALLLSTLVQPHDAAAGHSIMAWLQRSGSDWRQPAEPEVAEEVEVAAAVRCDLQ
jgi:hypothetical protein